MQENPLVTIGLPFFNNVASVRQTVTSVLNQTFTDWELILIDDGSNDGSAQELGSLNDARIRWITHRENRGQTARLNEVTGHARGRFIARMDADDIMHPRRIEKQVEYLLRHPHIDLVATPCVVIDKSNRIVGLRGPAGIVMERRRFLRTSQIVHPSVMGRREFFVRFPYDERYARSQDRELWCRSCVGARFAELETPLIFYREDNPNAHRNYRLHSDEDRRIIREYGPAATGLTMTGIRLLECRTKEALYRSACAVGLEPWWKRRRNRALPKEARADYESALKAALASLCGPVVVASVGRI